MFVELGLLTLRVYPACSVRNTNTVPFPQQLKTGVSLGLTGNQPVYRGLWSQGTSSVQESRPDLLIAHRQSP